MNAKEIILDALIGPGNIDGRAAALARIVLPEQVDQPILAVHLELVQVDYAVIGEVPVQPRQHR